MRCSVLIALSFIFCSVAYGASSAAVAQGLYYFTPELIIVFRMLFGFGFNLIVLLFRMAFERDYTGLVRMHFTLGRVTLVHIAIGGLFNLAIPHSLIAIAQQWIPSAAVQLAKPLIPAVSQLAGHFLIPDERFTWLKFGSLLCALIGVSACAVPSFRGTDSTAGALDVALGFGLLIVAVISLGFASVYFKWKSAKCDITVSSCVQTAISFVVDMIWSLAMDGPAEIKRCVTESPWQGWIWPLLLGVLASGVAVHGFMYLVKSIGAVGANFVPFGQIVVGVALGVAWLGEWDTYEVWEIGLSCGGILLLMFAIVIGFWHGKEDEEVEPKDDAEEEEERPGPEDEHEHLDEI